MNRFFDMFLRRLDWLLSTRLVQLFFGTQRRQLVTVASAFGLLPLATNSFLAWQAWDDPTVFAGEANLYFCYKVAEATCAATLANLIAFALLRLGPKKTLLFIFLQSIAVIFAFAGIYQGHGLAGTIPMSPAEMAKDPNFTSLYFSIVTWTTVGYGDFVAPPDIRMVAAFEALLGYFTFGMLVGLLTAVAADARIGGAIAAPAPRGAARGA